MRKLLTTLVTVAVLLVVADRVAAAVAGNVLAGQIAQRASLGENPDVSVHGFPFLTQVAGGRYDDVEVTAEGVRAGRVRGVTVDAHLRGAHLPLSDLISRHVEEVPVDQVTGTASVRYADLVRAAPLPDGVRIDSVRRRGDGLAVRATVSVAGQSLSATGRATVRVDRGALVVTASRVTVPDLPAGLPDVPGLAGRLSFRIPVEDLPFGLRLTDVHPTDTGLSASAQARDVDLTGSASGT